MSEQKLHSQIASLILTEVFVAPTKTRSTTNATSYERSSKRSRSAVEVDPTRRV